MEFNLKDFKVFCFQEEYTKYNDILHRVQNHIQMLYKHHLLPISDVYNILKNIKGKFLLSYNNSTEAKELFKNYKIKYLKTTYTDPVKGGSDRIKTEIIICTEETRRRFKKN